jgi:hypothetical protein
MALDVFNTPAAMIAPCSVKALGNVFEYLRFSRESQFATTSAFSSRISRIRYSIFPTGTIAFFRA